MAKPAALMILFFFSVSWASDKVSELAKGLEWHRLMHYKTSFWPGSKPVSQLDGEDFFFAEDGKTNPEAELRATIEAFSKDDLKVGKLKQHPQCAFPQRLVFVKRELGLSFNPVRCEKLEEFLQKFQGESVTYVFSTAYPNNPGSMFGHTFLRVNSPSKKGGRGQLLDYGLSFAAYVPPNASGGVLYAVFGLFGGFRGSFAMVPYYAKVAEYNHSESRDLWEYNLNMNREETLVLLRHVWEIETNSHYNYYFFDENCAYHLLSLIEVAKPEWKLTGDGWFYIPADSVKALTDIPGAVRSVSFRPSLRKKIEQKLSGLSVDERKVFDQQVKGEGSIDHLSNPYLLETLADYFNYIKAKNKELTKDEKVRFSRVLHRRSVVKVDAKTRKLRDFEKGNRPDLGHDSFNFQLSTGARKTSLLSEKTTSFQRLRFKFAYHDLLNRDDGYESFSQVDFPHLTLQLEEEKLHLQYLMVASVTSLFPVSSLETRLSWKLVVDHRRATEINCGDCHLTRVSNGSGFTFGFFRKKLLFYGLLTADAEFGAGLERGYRLGPKLTAASLAQLGNVLKGHLSYQVLWRGIPISFVAVQSKVSLDFSYVGFRNWDLRLGLHRIEAKHPSVLDEDQVVGTLSHYF